MRTFALTLLLALASPAVASAPRQLSLPVGRTMTLAMPNLVSQVRVNDPGLVEVKTTGRNVTFVALTRGTTEAVVTTIEGEHRFKIYVAADKYALPYQ
jgi:hypothetical protein